MSNQILQAGRALAVIPSDYANIPFPAVVTSGMNSDVVSPNELADPNNNFIVANVKTGDIVYNVTSQLAATVLKVVNENTLKLNNDIFTVYDCEYIIYQASPQTGSGNMGCVLYVGSNGNVDIITTGQDNVTLVGVNKGSFIPVHVLKVTEATTATDIVALW